MENLTTRTIREIALEVPQTTRVFEEFRIDYCCGGKRMFMEACHTAGANPQAVIEKINKVVETSDNKELKWLQDGTPGQLIDHILETHHVFTRKEIENLKPLMEKVAGRHGEKHPHLLKLKNIFQFLCQDLGNHMNKEEVILFPYIRHLEMDPAEKGPTPPPPFGTVRNPVRMMMMEHDQAGELLREMRGISNDYSLPPDACPSYTALYKRLEELERDLHEHIHLENNLLFPKAVELEEKT